MEPGSQSQNEGFWNAIRLEAIAIWVEDIATRVEAIASRLEEAIAIRFLRVFCILSCRSQSDYGDLKLGSATLGCFFLLAKGKGDALQTVSPHLRQGCFGNMVVIYFVCC